MLQKVQLCLMPFCFVQERKPPPAGGGFLSMTLNSTILKKGEKT